MSSSGEQHDLHLILLPSAGMGHLIPFLRLAASLIRHRCRVTLITTHPTISLSESHLVSRFSSHPQFNVKQFHLLPLDPATANSDDPFFLGMERIRRSAHLLRPLLASLHPPPSALISDVSLITPVNSVTVSLRLPNYVLFTSSARMLSLFTYFPNFNTSLPSLQIPGIATVPRSSIPPLLLDPATLFYNFFVSDGPNVKKLNGFLINTFEGLEGESLAALNGGKVVDGLPPVFAVGPLTPSDLESRDDESGGGGLLKWLDDQPPDSVVYVSFGSRTSMERGQMRELGDGLVRSGFRFIWVVKGKKVDRDDEESLEEALGHELMERVEEKGLVVKRWVDQWGILGHGAVGGFVSHCGWNSVMEAAWHGVRVLAWPQSGDQKVNAEVVEMSGLGMFPGSWGWAGEGVVNGEEIGKRVKEMMGSQELKVKARQVGEEARKGVADGRNFQNILGTFIGHTTTGGQH